MEQDVLEQLTMEQDVFGGFKFDLGQLVEHQASGAVGIVVSRILIQAATGNTGHAYEVSTGDRYIKRLEIELKGNEG